MKYKSLYILFSVLLFILIIIFFFPEIITFIFNYLSFKNIKYYIILPLFIIFSILIILLIIVEKKDIKILNYLKRKEYNKLYNFFYKYNFKLKIYERRFKRWFKNTKIGWFYFRTLIVIFSGIIGIWLFFYIFSYKIPNNSEKNINNKPHNISEDSIIFICNDSILNNNKPNKIQSDSLNIFLYLKNHLVEKGNNNSTFFTTFLTICSILVLFSLWIIRDRNKKDEIENTRKDTNLKDFHQLSQWATGMHIDMNKKDNLGAMELQAASILQLSNFLDGTFGKQFQLPAFQILIQLSERITKAIEKELKEINKIKKEDEKLKDEKLFKLKKEIETTINSQFLRSIHYSLFQKRGYNLRLHKQLIPNLSFCGFNTYHPILIEKGIDLDGLNLSDTKWILSKIENSNFEFTNLSKADFFESKIDFSHFENSKIIYSHLENSKINYSHFENAKILSSLFENAKIDSSHFENTIIHSSHFENTKIRYSHFENAKINFSHFENAKIDSSNFENAKIVYSHFENANISYSHFENANIDYSHFKNANIDYSHFENANISSSHFENANISSSHFENANIKSSGFENANIVYSNFENAGIESSYFEKSKIKLCIFDYSVINNVYFNNLEIKNVYFENSKIKDTEWNNSIIEFSSFENADSENCNFKDAELKNVNMKNTKFKNTNFQGTIFENILINSDTEFNDSFYDDNTKFILYKRNENKIIEYKSAIGNFISFIKENNLYNIFNENIFLKEKNSTNKNNYTFYDLIRDLIYKDKLINSFLFDYSYILREIEIIEDKVNYYEETSLSYEDKINKLNLFIKKIIYTLINTTKYSNFFEKIHQDLDLFFQHDYEKLVYGIKGEIDDVASENLKKQMRAQGLRHINENKE